jgi:hypothetical protein
LRLVLFLNTEVAVAEAGRHEAAGVDFDAHSL